MCNVTLLKQNVKYVKDGEGKTAINFFLQCGNERVPIEIKYFEGEDGKDKFYLARKTLLGAFAELLPEKPIAGSFNLNNPISKKS